MGSPRTVFPGVRCLRLPRAPCTLWIQQGPLPGQATAHLPAPRIRSLIHLGKAVFCPVIPTIIGRFWQPRTLTDRVSAAGGPSPCVWDPLSQWPSSSHLSLSVRVHTCPRTVVLLFSLSNLMWGTSVLLCGPLMKTVGEERNFSFTLLGFVSGACELN